MIGRFRNWLSALLARWSGKLAVEAALPYAEPQGAVDSTYHRPPRFSVARWQDGKHWLAYEGSSGGDARRVYEGVIERREGGKMEFWQNVGEGKVVVRGSYDRIR